MGPDQMYNLRKQLFNDIEKPILTSSITKFLRLIKNIVPELTIILIAIWTVPGIISFPNPGLDPSWKIGIYIAAANNLQFGKDIIFTFGPLGFLWEPIIVDYQHWAFAMAFILLTHFLLFLGIYLLLKRITVKWYFYFILIPTFALVVPFIDYKILMAVSFLMYSFILKEKFNRIDIVAMAGISLLLAVTSLIKFNMFIIALSIIVMASIAFILTKKSITYPLYIVLSYVIFLLVIWVALDQNLVNFPDYVMNGIEISKGYNDAMVIQPTNTQTLIELASIGFVSIVFIYSIIKGKKSIWLYVLFNAAFFLTVYKYGLIRNNVIFYLVYVPLLTIFLIILINEIRIPCITSIEFLIVLSAILILATQILVLYPQATWILNNNVINKIPSYTVCYNLLTDPSLSDKIIISSKDKIKKYYALDPKMISNINNNTIDIFPWDIAVCWAYDLNWSPRPVFQSYSAYTEKLGRINSEHFIVNQSPQYILYSYQSIDYRYPQLDEPDTFRALLYNYRYVNYSNGFILLERKEDYGIPQEVTLGTTEGKIGEVINIPEYKAGYLYGKINVKSTLYGKVLDLLYKPEQVNIRFIFKNGSSSPTYRLIPATAREGLFLSSYIASTEDMVQVFQGEISNDISGIVIDTPDRKQYDDHITIEFIEVPVNSIKIKEV